MVTFEDIGIMPDVLKAVRALGFENPMPIQEKVIPVLLNTKDDLIGLAQTGTGNRYRQNRCVWPAHRAACRSGQPETPGPDSCPDPGTLPANHGRHERFF